MLGWSFELAGCAMYLVIDNTLNFKQHILHQELDVDFNLFLRPNTTGDYAHDLGEAVRGQSANGLCQPPLLLILHLCEIESNKLALLSFCGGYNYKSCEGTAATTAGLSSW